MNQFDFNAAAQSGLAQFQSFSRQALALSENAVSAQIKLAQDNAEAAFGLWNAALDVRDADGVKNYFADATRVARESFERSFGVSQNLFAAQTRAAQDLGRQVKDQVEQAAKGQNAKR